MTESLRDRLYQTPGIVLQCRDLGEADRIYVVFTPGYGKASIIAKGARRAKSRLGPYLDYFVEVTLNLTRGRDLDVVTGVVTVDQHPGLRGDLTAFAYASHFAELVRDLTQEHQAHPGVYELLASSLSLLDQGVDPWHLARFFELHVLQLLGYRPELFQCANCQRDIQAEPNVFSSVLGGVLCPECAPMDPGAIMLSVAAQKYLRTMERDGLSRVIGLRIGDDVRHQVALAMASYLHATSERPLRSLAELPGLYVVDGPGSGQDGR
ncbi:MAG TPA: DNA repair protein RecO [Thermomicrobiales bacterium]|nr:DNA repair protein RecO [Thermomicrobiales bacterium]